MLNGVAAPASVKVEDLATDTARERLVLGSGGVARDYLDLVSKALRKSNERTARPDRPHNRITAEDVNEAAADLSGRKQDDLKLAALRPSVAHTIPPVSWLATHVRNL